MSWRRWVVPLLALWLAACGGGHEETTSDARRLAAAANAATATRSGETPSAASAAAPLEVDADALFDWAEWMYPALFPKGPASTVIAYQGRSYTVRAYATGNYLGLANGDIYGLGPFTKNVLTLIGRLDDYASQVRADVCLFRGIDCHPPVIDTQPLALHTMEGQPASFSVKASSTLALSYRWQVSPRDGVDFADIPGATASDYNLPAVTVADHGKRYRVVMANRHGTVVSAAVLLMVRPPQASQYFPLEPDSMWVYQRSDGQSVQEVRVVGTQTVEGGQTGTVVETHETSDNSTSRDVFLASAEGVRQYSSDPSDAFDRVTDGIIILKLPPVPGESIPLVDQTVDSEIDVDGDGVSDQMHIVATLKTIGIEPLSTPTIRFAQTLHQRIELVSTFFSSRGAESVVVRSTADVWYADGIGQVKWLTSTAGLGAYETETYVLQSFRVDGLSSTRDPRQVRSIGTGMARRDGRPIARPAARCCNQVRRHIDAAARGDPPCS